MVSEEARPDEQEPYSPHARTTLAEARRVFTDHTHGCGVGVAKLVPYVRRELSKRGIDVPEPEVRAWFDGAPATRKVPLALCDVLRHVPDGLLTGLVPLAELVGPGDRDEWLEGVRARLQFRSHSAMHKAIAQATGLKYDCVHKSLSGSAKPNRIRVEIKECLERWLDDLNRGVEPTIADEFRRVSVEEMQGLMDRLQGRYGTKEEIYALVSKDTGIRVGSVRRYFRSEGQLTSAPLCVYRCALALIAEGEGQGRPGSYLQDPNTREVVREVAHKANQAFAQWRRAKGSAELELAYKELRRAVVVTMKENRLPELLSWAALRWTRAQRSGPLPGDDGWRRGRLPSPSGLRMPRLPRTS